MQLIQNDMKGVVVCEGLSLEDDAISMIYKVISEDK